MLELLRNNYDILMYSMSFHFFTITLYNVVLQGQKETNSFAQYYKVGPEINFSYFPLSGKFCAVEKHDACRGIINNTNT